MWETSCSEKRYLLCDWSVSVLFKSTVALQEGVGYGPGVYGDQVVRWHPIDIAKVEHKVDVGNDPLGLRTLEFFSGEF